MQATGSIAKQGDSTEQAYTSCSLGGVHHLSSSQAVRMLRGICVPVCVDYFLYISLSGRI